MNIACSTMVAVQKARSVLAQHGVRQIREQGPFQVDPPDPNIYLIVSDPLSEQQIAQIRAALRRIAGVTVQP
jgi:hypothetical protein